MSYEDALNGVTVYNTDNLKFFLQEDGQHNMEICDQPWIYIIKVAVYRNDTGQVLMENQRSDIILQGVRNPFVSAQAARKTR